MNHSQEPGKNMARDAYPKEKPEHQPFLRFDISEDQLSCRVLCYPREEAYSLEEFEEAMYKANVLFGVDYQRVEEIIQQVNHEKTPVLGEVIAKGIVPVNGTNFQLEAGKIPLKSKTELAWEKISVRKGDVLFRVLPATRSQNGMNVLGMELRADEEITSPYQAGSYCSYLEKKGVFKALADGLVQIDEESLVSIDISSASDSQLFFEVSSDRREAFLSCSPRDSSSYQMDEAEEGLYAAKIIYGIDYDRIEAMLEMVNQEVAVFHRELIAQGDRELDGTDAEVEFRYPVDTDQKCMVHEGDEIAVVIPGLPPKEGLNVSGKKIQGTEGSSMPLKTGDGCVFNRRQQVYLAAVTGVAQLRNGILSITPTEVEEEVAEPKEKPSLQPGELKFEVAEDQMSAVMLCAPKEEGVYSMDEFEEAIYDAGIVHGIYYEKLEGLLERVNTESDFCVWGEVIARGDFPTDGSDEVLNIYFWKDGIENELIRFDPGYELIENQVKESQPVASLLPRNRPSYGLTVTGRNIIGKDGREVDLIFSDDFLFEKETHLFRAKINGEVVIEDKQVRIQPEIKEEILIEGGFSDEAEIGDDSEEKVAPIQLTVSSDLMTMTMTMKPRKGKPWEFYDLEDCVYKHDVVYGIEFERMEELMNLVNSEGRAVEDEVIARGELPTEGKSQRTILHFSKNKAIDLTQSSLSKVLDSGEVGHEYLDQNDKVLEIIPAKPGVEGFTVTGAKLKPKKKITKADQYKPGENLVPGPEKGTYIAKVPGQVQIKGKTVSIKPVLFIDHDVSLKSGDIHFHGNVVIQGNVRTGMKVVAKGNLFINGRIEIATIQSGGDLTIVGGVQGGLQGKKALITVGGDMRTKFCNHALLKCRGDILIENSLLHSDVECEGTIRILEEGKGIMGGRIRAMLGIETSFLGSSLGIATEVNAGGFNHEVKLSMARTESARKRLQKVIEDLMTRLRPYEGKELDDHPKKILEKILLMRKELAEALQKDKSLVLEYEKYKDSLVDKSQIRVTVRNTVYPDVRIQVERSVMSQFYEPLHECVFQEHKTRPIVEVLPIASEEDEEESTEEEALEEGMIH